MQTKKILSLIYTSTSTSNQMDFGENGDTGFIQAYRDLIITASKLLKVNTIQSTFSTTNVDLYNNSTSGNINISTGLTSGNVNISNVSASGVINLNTNVVIPLTESLSVTTISSNGSSSALGIGNNIVSNSISIGNSINNGVISLGNSSAVSCNINANNDIIMSSNKNISLSSTCKLLTNNIEAFGTNALSIANTNTVSGISIGTGLTTANLQLGGAGTTGRIVMGNLSATPSVNTGHITINNRIHNIFSGGSQMFNIGLGTGLFNITGGGLSGKQLTTTMYANAPITNFNCFEGVSGGEGCATLMNGDTHILINPCDAGGFSLFFLDEDVMTTADNYAWVGWKMSITGVVTSSSDRRIKRDIKPIVKPDLLKILSKIQFVNYRKKAPTEDMYRYKKGPSIGKLRSKYQVEYMGCIAQDVSEAGLGEVVDRENNNSYYTIRYQDMGIYFNMGVQELIKENIELKKQITKMDNFLKNKFADYE